MYLLQFDRLTFWNWALHQVYEERRLTYLLLVLPLEYRFQVLEKLNDQLGHQALERMLALMTLFLLEYYALRC